MTFRKRIISTFLLFASLLTLVFAILLDNLMNYVEDEVSRDFLAENLAYLEKRLQSDSNPKLLMDTYKVKTHGIYSSHMAKAKTGANNAYNIEGATVDTLLKPRMRRVKAYTGTGFVLEQAIAIYPQESGRLIIPVGTASQALYLYEKGEDGTVERTKVCDVRYVPLQKRS